ncbi:hypothetical protein [Microbacterium thalassium]|uniref:Uncharacterized protein n=1 Tax=Microbacterium thalassium TaxID=362649 RepID=A0A7X0FS09_9MICO|nr:hypothetical protein [Microbacterium thalassium]MBB6392652.1 hypothetical protein [Microbacterium thalassium]GLK23117.1 hypothetical protein GCM10017607_04350 [Microbacterium thalassium]
MHTRGKIIGAIGALAGIALAVTTAVLPASAAKPVRGGGESSSGVTCSSLDGRTVTASGVSEVVAMTAGETLSVSASPALAEDRIIATVVIGLAFDFYEAPATSGFHYTAGISTTHSFSWSYEAAGTRPASLTWTFSCSSGGSGGGSTTVSDADGDGVADSADVCSGTSLPDSVRKAAGGYYANKSGVFIDGTGAKSGYTITDTAGCSAKQIAAEVGLKKSQSRTGISLSVLKSWVAAH